MLLITVKRKSSLDIPHKRACVCWEQAWNLSEIHLGVAALKVTVGVVGVVHVSALDKAE